MKGLCFHYKFSIHRAVIKVIFCTIDSICTAVAAQHFPDRLQWYQVTILRNCLSDNLTAMTFAEKSQFWDASSTGLLLDYLFCFYKAQPHFWGRWDFAHNYKVPAGGTLRSPSPVIRYVIQLGELERLQNIWLDYAVGKIYQHALSWDAASCVESQNKQQGAWFFPARYQCLGLGFAIWNEH